MIEGDVDLSLSLLLTIFVSDLLPVFAIAGIGFLLARHTGVQVLTVSRVTFHALAPAMIFQTLVTSSLSGGDFGRMVLFHACVVASTVVIARVAAVPLRLSREALTGFMLVVVCSNSGNYGLPVALLAFGPEALAFASVYFISSSIFAYTGGVLLAASGRRSLPQALAGVFRVPAVWGAAAAGVALGLGVTPPEALMRPVTMLGSAALPMMVLVLGMQLERASWPERPVVVATAVALSLIVTPLAALGLSHVVGLQGPALQAGVLQASMPTAVITTILALEFEVAPAFVTSVVAVSTLLSPFTVTWLIAYLQRHA